jgi:hypothetical protein
MSDPHLSAPGEPAAEHHDVTKAEHDRLPIGKVIGLVIATSVALVIAVIAIVQYFDASLRAEIDRKVLSQPSQALDSLRATETVRLTRYAWADQKAGVVRIPLERATELVIAEWDSRPSEPVEWTDEAAAAPPAPAPTEAPPSETPAPSPPPAGEPPTPAPPAPTGTAPILQPAPRPPGEQPPQP